MTRWGATAAILVAALTILLTAAHTPASARYLGSDMMGNTIPSTGLGGLTEKYPLSAYRLDYHVDGPSVGITGVSAGDVPELISQWLANAVWGLTAFLATLAIHLFAWAFSLDLLNGQHGALQPVGDAVRNIYNNVTVGWLSVAVLLLGGWMAFKGAKREYTGALAGMAVSVVCVLIGMWLIFDTEDSIGQASSWSNDISTGILTATNGTTSPAAAKRAVGDQLTLVLKYTPWVALEFGGLKHCVDVSRRQDDDFPTPVLPDDPHADVCRDHIKANAAGYGGYAAWFLDAPGQADRDRAYEALRTGEIPSRDNPIQNPGLGRPPIAPTVPTGPDPLAGARVDKNDSPAADAMQAGGSWQRLFFAAGIFLGTLGAVAVIAYMAIMIILAQLLAMVAFAAVPVAALFALIPGVGHEAFRKVVGILGLLLFAKVFYTLALAVILTISGTILAATGELGGFVAFALICAFYWSLFWSRRMLGRGAVKAVTGGRPERLPTSVRRVVEHPLPGVKDWRDHRRESERHDRVEEKEDRQTERQETTTTTTKTATERTDRAQPTQPAERPEWARQNDTPQPAPARAHTNGKPPPPAEEPPVPKREAGPVPDKPHVTAQPATVTAQPATVTRVEPADVRVRTHETEAGGANYDMDRDTSHLDPVPVRVRDE